MKIALPLIVVVIALSAACGFECTVKGAKEQFAGCEDLQAAYSAEQSRVAPGPDLAALDNLDTCGAANGCVITR